MNDETGTRNKLRGCWINVISFAVVHLIAFGMLYLVLVQMNWAFQDFFEQVGAKATPRFEAISTISDFIAAYTQIALLVIALDILVVCRLARKASRWTSAYSHGVLLCMGFCGFLWTAWAVHTMAWGAPGVANAPEVVPADPQIAHLATVDILAEQ